MAQSPVFPVSESPALIMAKMGRTVKNF